LIFRLSEFQISLNTFAAALRTKDLVITSEILLGSQSGDVHINEQAEALRGHVDGLLVTDNQSGRLHMSSLVASFLLKQAGVDPIMQLGCRNRNRISLLGDLLGADALGIRNLQLVRGERVPNGFVPRPNALLDVTATELLEIANRMKTGDSVANIPDLLLGGVVTPRAPKPDWPARKLVEKIDAGARFLITHTCMDADIVRKYMKHLVALRITHRASVMASIAVICSAQDAQWLRENKTNVMIPDALVDEIESHPQSREKGIEIAAGLVREYAEIPGLSGVHVFATTDVGAVPEVIQKAGL
jgi:methylenetetrahydrofolate reductase (NADPH)